MLMALLITTDDKPIFLAGPQANYLWRIKTGERKGSPALIAKVSKIAKWYLNRNTAPQSYLDEYPAEYDKRKTLASRSWLPYND